MAGSRIKGITIEIGGDTTKLQEKRQEQLRQEARELQENK